VNPIGIVGAVSAVSSLLGMGSSIVNQSINIHRQLHPPQQQAQVQRCPTPAKLVVVITQNGQRELMCVQEESK